MPGPTKKRRSANYAVILYMQQLGAQVVAQTGIPSDMFHLGKLTLKALRNDPDHVLQIDAAVKDSETNRSVLERSVQCAIALKNLGLQRGDVIILMAPNHLDLCIPFYAALYLGLCISGIDMFLGVKELKSTFESTEPSIIFCHNDKAADVVSALQQCKTNAHIVTFDAGSQFNSFSNLIQDISTTHVQDFLPADFDPEETVAFLTTTSGSTGVPKSAALTHKNVALGLPQCCSKAVRRQKDTTSSSSSDCNAVNTDSDYLSYLNRVPENANTTCMFGESYYSNDRPGEPWIQCQSCDLWAYTACAGANFFDFPKPTRLDLCVSPLQWISAGIKFVTAPLLGYTRLQTSALVSNDHIYDIINTYKPSSTILSPNLMTSLMAQGERERCDFSCFKDFCIGGSFVSQALVDTAKLVAPNAAIQVMYGMSEASSLALLPDPDAPIGSVGRPLGYLQYRIIDVSSSQDIDEPHVTGELWMKGPTIFKGYHNNPEDTKEAFTEDGWFKSGDLVYRDEHGYFFYVDRLKALLKYRNHQVSPVELEQVIRTHPGVLEAAVVGIPHEEHGDLPAAAVVLEQGAVVTAQEIKNLVKDNLTDSKQLRGGVVFMEELPLTATSKVDRMKLKKIVIAMERQ